MQVAGEGAEVVPGDGEAAGHGRSDRWLVSSLNPPEALRIPGSGRGQAPGQAADRRVFATAGAIVVVSLVVKAGTAVRELLIAWYFGTSDPLDAYLIAYAVPYFFITLLGASLAPVLVPA